MEPSNEKNSHHQVVVRKTLNESSIFEPTTATEIWGASSACYGATFRSVRRALGTFGSIVIIGGTVITLSVMAVLIFLWTGEGIDDGQNALSTWRSIILNQWITQAITLVSVLQQVTTAAQASVCTGLVAAMVLERHGVPLSCLAEYSLIRSNNDGPLRLSWLMVKSFRKSVAFLTLMTTVLLVGSIGAQFTSTLLVSDLGTASIVGSPRNDSRGVSASFNTLNQFHLINQYFLKPSFMAFGEVPGSDPTPNDLGVSDTGIVKRIHPFVSRDNRTTIRDYYGRGFVFNSRLVCMRPIIDNVTVQYRPLNNPSFAQDFLAYLSGNISFNETLRAAGLEVKECPNGECFAHNFNCTVSTRTGTSGKLAVSGCIPSGRNAPLPSYNSTITDEPITNTSETFLIMRDDIIFNTTFDMGTNYIPTSISASDEWTTYTFKNGITLQASLCFQQLHYDRATVHLSTAQNLKDATVQWNANTSNWDTKTVRKLFGFPGATTRVDAVARGIYSVVDDISNISRSSTVAYLRDVMISDSYNSFQEGNVTIFLSPYSGGDALIVPHVDYQALFADTLDETNRPAFAFQNLITTLSGSIIDSLLTQLDIMEDIRSISSVSVQAPKSYLGLALVLTIGVINLTTVIILTSLYLTRTEHTSSGNYWHAIAQIVSETTQPIFHRATHATDEEVTQMLKDHDIEVRLGRRGFDGRVEVG